jgi:hypothetical protein
LPPAWVGGAAEYHTKRQKNGDERRNLDQDVGNGQRQQRKRSQRDRRQGRIGEGQGTGSRGQQLTVNGVAGHPFSGPEPVDLQIDSAAVHTHGEEAK